MGNLINKTKIYLVSFFKYYLPKKKKLIFVFIFSFAIYLWIAHITNNIIAEFGIAEFGTEASRFSIRELLQSLRFMREGIFILFIKPIFVYIAGLIIIKNI